MKKLYAVVFALMVLISVALSAAALESKTINRQSGLSAYASWSEMTTDGFADTYLNVAETYDGTDIYISVCTSDSSGNYSCKWGYKFTTDNVFEMDGKLNSASLSAVQVDLYDWYSYTPEPTTIQAQWTGVGDTSKGSYKSISKYGDYISKYSDSSTYREATATGTRDGQDLGASAYAGLVKFKSAYMYMEK